MAVIREMVDGDEPPPSPRWSEEGVPFCSENECPYYDGKRCRALGRRPGPICEPLVIEMAKRLEDPS